MVKAILFDFDGVICESSQVKTDAFNYVFNDYPLSTEDIIAYHKAHEGISRDIKLKFICEEILSVEYSEERRGKLLSDFAAFVDNKSKSLPLVKGVEEFLINNKDSYEYFIVSGARQIEIESYLKNNNLFELFREIHDGSKSKSIIIEDIMTRYQWHPHEIVFIGDALTDLKAAEKLALPAFIARVYREGTPLSSCKYQIEDFLEIDALFDLQLV